MSGHVILAGPGPGRARCVARLYPPVGRAVEMVVTFGMSTLRWSSAVVARSSPQRCGGLAWTYSRSALSLPALGSDDWVAAVFAVAGVAPFHPRVLAAVLVLAL